MANILCSPSKYVQGAGEMKKLGEYAQKYGKKALVLITESGYKRIEDVLKVGFEGYDIEPVYEYFNRECSKTEINRLVAVMNEKGCDVVIGIGGGKILDTAKAVAYYKEVPVLICPTIASTDAPCSALSVIYTDEGVFEEYLFLPANPNMVLMDTEIIAKSPVRLTVSGMGGGLAGAHAIHNGFTVLDECHHMYHGEKVAFGTITQLVLEDIPAEELEDIIDWCIELGLPVTLKELGITEVTDEKLMAVATAACAENDTLHNMPFEVTPETVCAAIKAADAYGRYFLGE